MNPKQRVGIVGAGRVGAKRAREVARSEESRLAVVIDTDATRAEALAAEYGCRSGTDWESLVSGREVNAVVVATTHRWLAPVTLAALNTRKHVLCEKPLAMNSQEARRLVEAALRTGAKLKVGFNHRYHPALLEAHRLLVADEIGRPLWVRCRYGHGGRRGYELEWRARPEESGGGELLDQGIHVFDLLRWFCGEFAEIAAVLTTSFWPVPLEDNAFCTLQTPLGVVAQMHVSWTQWKNTFSFELAGSRGYLMAEGLGGNYGPERLRIGHRSDEFEPPDERVMEFGEEDASWEREWREFLAAIREDRPPAGDGRDAVEALRLVEAARVAAGERRVISLSEKEEHAEPRIHRAVFGRRAASGRADRPRNN